MSLELGLVLGRAALELDWSEKPSLLRALWQFCATIAQVPLHRPLKERIGRRAKAGHRKCRNPIWRWSAYSRNGDESSD